MGWSCDARAWDFASRQSFFTLEAVEIFCEASTMCFEVMLLNNEHEKGVDFIEGV